MRTLKQTDSIKKKYPKNFSFEVIENFLDSFCEKIRRKSGLIFLKKKFFPDQTTFWEEMVVVGGYIFCKDSKSQPKCVLLSLRPKFKKNVVWT